MFNIFNIVKFIFIFDNLYIRTIIYFFLSCKFWPWAKSIFIKKLDLKFSSGKLKLLYHLYIIQLKARMTCINPVVDLNPFKTMWKINVEVCWHWFRSNCMLEISEADVYIHSWFRLHRKCMSFLHLIPFWDRLW